MNKIAKLLHLIFHTSAQSRTSTDRVPHWITLTPLLKGGRGDRFPHWITLTPRLKGGRGDLLGGTVTPRLKGGRGDRGFTLIEAIVVVVIIGILSAIAAPSWIAFVDGRRLSVAQDQILRSLQAAQSNAKRDKIIWQVSFRENNGVAQWSILPANTNPIAISWQNLDSAIRIVDPIVNANDPDGTTLEFDPTNNIWRMQFNYRGEANSPLGKIAIAIRNGGQRWSCVKVSTLLGAIQSATDENCH